MPVPIADYEPPEQWILEEDALRNFRLKNPEEYKRMTKKQREKVARDGAAEIRRHAEALIATGAWAGEAWNQARKSESLGSERD